VRARRLVAAGGPGAGVALAWLLLLALAGATALRVLRRLRPRAPVVAVATIAVLLVPSLLAPASAAAVDRPDPAKGLSSFPIDDADPVAHLPAPESLHGNPIEYGYLVMDLAENADQATRRRDYQQAVKYYLALAKLAPDRAIGLAKACEMYELAGARDEALTACRVALRIDGVRGEDYERFVRLVLASVQPLTAAERDELSVIIKHFEGLPGGARVAAQIDCKLGVRTEDVARLERCTQKLAQLAPDGSAAVGYRWALATLKKDSRGARRVLDDARQAGLHPDGFERMDDLTRRSERFRMLAYGVAAVLALAALALLGARRAPALLARRSVS
jgi:hypothetical protein